MPSRVSFAERRGNRNYTMRLWVKSIRNIDLCSPFGEVYAINYVLKRRKTLRLGEIKIKVSQSTILQ